MNLKQQFIEQIIKNLDLNGFPQKKVSFDLEKMYEVADNKGFSLNEILDSLSEHHQILHEKTIEKIIFFKDENSQDLHMNQDLLKQAQEMMANMSSEEIENIKSMYENMSSEEKENMIEQAKKIGLL